MTDEPRPTALDRPPLPWFADKDVAVLTYRINRRPLMQGNLLTVMPERFLEHLHLVLLFGVDVVTGRRYQRYWRLGNEDYSLEQGFLSGRVGYRSSGIRVDEYYQDDIKAWATDIVPADQVVSAPFVVVERTQHLHVAKHPSFSESTLPTVFEMLLSEGEQRRPQNTADWGVDPVLDEQGFADWLKKTPILDRVTFKVKLPNPDAEEAFAQVVGHLDRMEAKELTHELVARDPERGLNREFQSDPTMNGLMEMSRRAYAWVTAKGRGLQAQIRVYNQRHRVLKQRLAMPATYDDAQETLVQSMLARAKAMAKELGDGESPT